MGVSENSGVFPPNHPLKNRVFPWKKPSILGENTPIFGSTPRWTKAANLGHLQVASIFLQFLGQLLAARLNLTSGSRLRLGPNNGRVLCPYDFWVIATKKSTWTKTHIFYQTKIKQTHHLVMLLWCMLLEIKQLRSLFGIYKQTKQIEKKVANRNSYYFI